MTVALTDELSLPFEYYSVLLSNCGTFQTLMSAADVAAAKAKILIWAADEQVTAEAALPRTIIDYMPHMRRTEKVSTSGWLSTGPIYTCIEMALPSQYLRPYKQSGFRYWLNQAGAMFREMKALLRANAVANLLNVTSLELLDVGPLDATETNGAGILGLEFVAHWNGE